MHKNDELKLIFKELHYIFEFNLLAFFIIISQNYAFLEQKKRLAPDELHFRVSPEPR